MEAPQLPPAPAVPSPPVDVPSGGAPLPQSPSVKLPTAPAPSAGAAPSIPRTASSGALEALAGGASSEGSTGSGAGAEGGAPRAGAGTPSDRGGGVHGTRHRTVRSLVRAFSGCLDQIPARGAKLLILRFGVGAFDRHPTAEVARILDIARSDYAAIRRLALRQLVREARRGSCEQGSGVIATTRVMFADWPGGPGSAGPGSVGTIGGAESGVPGGELKVLGESAEGVASDGPSPTGPAAILPEAAEGAAFPILLGVLAALLAGSLLWLIAVRPARHAAERKRAYRSYFSGPDR